MREYICMQLADRSSILPRIGHASILGHLYKNRQIPLDLTRSGGIFCCDIIGVLVR